MIVIVAGSRGYHRDEYIPLLDEAIRLSKFGVTRILHGDNMMSADRLARAWAKQRGIPEEGIAADWNRNGKAAGPIRNTEMERVGEALVALWDGVSPGTRDMIVKMKRAGKRGFVYRLDGAAHESFDERTRQLGLFPAPGVRR